MAFFTAQRHNSVFVSCDSLLLGTLSVLILLTLFCRVFLHSFLLLSHPHPLLILLPSSFLLTCPCYSEWFSFPSLPTRQSVNWPHLFSDHITYILVNWSKYKPRYLSHSYRHKHLNFHDSSRSQLHSFKTYSLALSFLWVFLEGERPAPEDTIQYYYICLQPLPFIYVVLQNITHMIMCDGIAVIYPSEKSNRQFGTSCHSPNSKSCIYLRCLHDQSLKWLSCHFSSKFLQKRSHVFIFWFVFSNKVFKIKHLSLFYIKYSVSNYWKFGFYILYILS